MLLRMAIVLEKEENSETKDRRKKMLRAMKTDFKCDECGGEMKFLVEDEDCFSIYGTLQCRKLRLGRRVHR